MDAGSATQALNWESRVLAQSLEVTPDLARTMLGTLYAHQRKPSSQQVDNYAKIMERGQWEAKAATIQFARLGGQFSLVNGQHTLRAVIKSKTTQVFAVSVRDCTSAEDMANFFTDLDIGRRRPLREGYEAWDLCEEFGFPGSFIVQFGAAVRHLRYIDIANVVDARRDDGASTKEVSVLGQVVSIRKQ